MVKAILGITQSASRVAAAVSKAIDRWKVHSHVWKADKDVVIDNLQVLLLLSDLKRHNSGDDDDALSCHNLTLASILLALRVMATASCILSPELARVLSCSWSTRLLPLQGPGTTRAAWEEQFEKYECLSVSVMDQAAPVEADVILVDPQPLAASCRNEAQAWVEALDSARKQAGMRDSF